MKSIRKIVVTPPSSPSRRHGWPTWSLGLSSCRKAVLGVALAGLLCGCGQKGPLILPEPAASSPAASTSPSR